MRILFATTQPSNWIGLLMPVETRFLSGERMRKGYERRSSIPWENGFYTVPLGLVLLDRKDLARKFVTSTTSGSGDKVIY